MTISLTEAASFFKKKWQFWSTNILFFFHTRTSLSTWKNWAQNKFTWNCASLVYTENWHEKRRTKNVTNGWTRADRQLNDFPVIVFSFSTFLEKKTNAAIALTLFSIVLSCLFLSTQKRTWRILVLLYYINNSWYL